jgi:hypothetical protein
MSASNAAARKRRAPNATIDPPRPPSASSTQSPATGLTLQQVIALIDKRLIVLEKHVKDQSTNPQPANNKSGDQVNHQLAMEQQMFFSQQLAEMTEEFNSRYSILAEEIDNMKNMLLKLQSYTMEVNKTLLEERIRILSDVEKEPIVSELTVQDLAENIGFSLAETIDTERFEMENTAN